MLDYMIATFSALVILPIVLIVLFIPMKKEIRILFLYGLLGILTMDVFVWFSRWQSVKLLDQLTQQTFTQITFERERQEAVIKHPAEITRFLMILKTAREVAAHHSSPDGKVFVIFPGRPERFTLGADSANPDEYWLQLENASYADVKQFHSQELTLWLQQNAVPLLKRLKGRPRSSRNRPATVAD